MLKKIATVTVSAAILLLAMSTVVENQGRKVTGTVVAAPKGLEDAGQPLAGAPVEYVEDGSVDVQVTTTDTKGYFEFPAGRSGVVTASYRQRATISVGWPSRNRTGELRIMLPRPSTLQGRLYDMSTRQTIREGMVSVMVDHPVNPVSNEVYMENGQFEFEGLPPGPALLVIHADGFAPTYTLATLEAGEQERTDIGLLLDGVVFGTVVDGTGDLVIGADIHAEYESYEGAVLLENFIGGITMTDLDGRFQLRGIVPDESFFIYATHEDGQRSARMRLRAMPGVPLENVVLRLD